MITDKSPGAICQWFDECEEDRFVLAGPPKLHFYQALLQTEGVTLEFTPQGLTPRAHRLGGQTVKIDAAYVDSRLKQLSRDEDLS